MGIVKLSYARKSDGKVQQRSFENNDALALNKFKSSKINDTQLALLSRLTNYKKGWNATQRELSKLVHPKEQHTPEDGWLLSRDVTNGVISQAHRSMYLKVLASPPYGLIEREKLQWIKKVKKRLVTHKKFTFYNTNIEYGKKPWLIYRLKRTDAVPFKMFKLFYEKGKVWELMKSDYFNDTLGEEFRFWLLKSISANKDLLTIGSNVAVVSRFSKEFYKLVSKGITIPPSMMYYFINGRSLPLSDALSLTDALLSFMIQDYLNCQDNEWRGKLLEAVNLLKTQGGSLK